MNRLRSPLLVLALAFVLAGCGGAGGIFGDTARQAAQPSALRQAVYASGTGRYTYSRDFLIGNAPDDADFSRWAMCHDGTNYHLYVMRHGSHTEIYRFTYDGGVTYVYTPIGAGPMQIEGVPQDASFESIAAVHGQGRTQLYTPSQSTPGLLWHFVLRGGTLPYFELDLAYPTLPLFGLPADADMHRWAMHHDGQNYRFLVFKQGSSETLYQAGWNASLLAYEYGYRSRDVVAVLGMPDATDRSTGAALHDDDTWHFYQLAWE